MNDKTKEALPLYEVSDVNNDNLKSLRTNQSVHNVPANKEWSNSVYSFDKNIYKSLPIKDQLAYNIINSYFSMTEEKKKKVNV